MKSFLSKIKELCSSKNLPMGNDRFSDDDFDDDIDDYSKIVK